MDYSEDDGFVAVKLPGGQEIMLDVYDAQSRLAEVYAKHKDGAAGEYFEAVLGVMEGLGMPRGSHRMADRFVKDVIAACATLKKKDSGGAGSPASTASTPEASASAS